MPVVLTDNKLNINFKSKKHFSGWILLDGEKAARIIIPKGRNTAGLILFKSMAKDLYLDTGEFDELLACPMTTTQYLTILRERKGNDY